MMIISGVASYAIFENKASNRKHNRDLAFQIAEAGINYYRWHLAHSPTDYWDGTGGEPGPYQHDYEDKNGTVIGYYSLEIDEPLAGSSVVIVRSTGWTTAEPQTKRELQVRLGFAALTDYTFLSNANMNFSFTTEVHGTTHSNGGIRFDGTTDSWVKSAKETYKYQNQTHNGVWGGGGPKSFWQYPVPEIDFFSVTADLSDIRDLADQSGTHYTASGKEGWHIVFTGATYKLYKVIDKSKKITKERYLEPGRQSSPPENISYYLEAIKKNPEDSDLHYNLAVVYLKNNQYADAAGSLKKAVSLNPKDKNAYYNLAVLYESYLNDTRQALEYYSRYLRLSSKAEDTREVKSWMNQIKKELKESKPHD